MISLVIGLLLFVSIPFDRMFSWLSNQYALIDSKLLKPRSLIFVSKIPFYYALIQFFQFLKGYLPLFVLFQLNYMDQSLLIVVILLILLLHNWPIWLKFQNQRHFLFVLLGIYTFISPAFVIRSEEKDLGDQRC